jgi:nucleoside-diphosphate-sugar epimerase
LARGVAKVRIVDDLTSGHLGNLKQHLGSNRIEFVQAGLREPGVARAAMHGVDTVFHLAADHGGRGYPNFMQSDLNKELCLTEDLTNGPNDADNTYGCSKLMAYAKGHGIGAASCRYFTVYGPRGVENHAVIAMIARAFGGQNPFEIWGNGTQIRNWTYVDDIVEGTILA